MKHLPPTTLTYSIYQAVAQSRDYTQFKLTGKIVPIGVNLLC